MAHASRSATAKKTCALWVDRVKRPVSWGALQGGGLGAGAHLGVRINAL